MTSEMIEKFIANKGRNGNAVNIHFKERSTVNGMFIEGKDFNELKSKNFWRIVSSTYMEEWKKTSNMELARIYNGNVFTRLSD